jgi:hypothetical protein
VYEANETCKNAGYNGLNKECADAATRMMQIFWASYGPHQIDINHSTADKSEGGSSSELTDEEVFDSPPTGSCAPKDWAKKQPQYKACRNNQCRKRIERDVHDQVGDQKDSPAQDAKVDDEGNIWLEQPGGKWIKSGSVSLE